MPIKLVVSDVDGCITDGKGKAVDAGLLSKLTGVAHVLVNTGKEIDNASVHSTEYYRPGHDIEYEVLQAVGYNPKTE